MEGERYAAPTGYSDSYDHFKNFFTSVRTRQAPVEDAVFGYRAAGAALLSNISSSSKCLCYHVLGWLGIAELEKVISLIFTGEQTKRRAFLTINCAAIAEELSIGTFWLYEGNLLGLIFQGKSGSLKQQMMEPSF